MNKSLESGACLDSWKESKTTLLPKNNKPKVFELRPIALMNQSYKILMGIVKKLIEEFLIESEQLNFFQTGGTTGRRVTENIYLLNYCIEKSYKMKKKLYVLAIDFLKAYDSIDRMSLITVLQDFNIHLKIIDIIAQIYNKDKTHLYMNKEPITDIEITSGIRQGCNLSALLFVLVTYKIIEKIQTLDKGYRDKNIHIELLFYMDDAIILANEEYKMSSILNRIENISMKYGLRLNKSKCKILIFNDNNNTKEINEIEVVNTVKYLGILIDNKRNCYGSQKQKTMSTANKYVNQIYSILGKSCNRMLIGKTFWKGMVLPNLLYGAEVIPFNKVEISKLQVFDNKAFRHILKVPTYAAAEFLRGEVGASSAESRDIKNKILFYKYAGFDTKNELLRDVIEKDMIEGTTKWARQTRSYMKELDLNHGDVRVMEKKHLEMKIKQWDDQKWKDGMENKTTLKLYREEKQGIDKTKWCKNGHKFSIIMQARSNTLPLAWRAFRNEEEKTCKVCNKGEIETLEHFLMECVPLQPTRNKYVFMQLPRQEDSVSLLKMLLILKESQEITSYNAMNCIADLWRARSKVIGTV